MGRSASLEQLNELEKTYSPMTPPPTLRFKAYQARKRYQRRKTDPEGRPLIFSVEKERKKTDSIPNKQQGQELTKKLCTLVVEHWYF